MELGKNIKQPMEKEARYDDDSGTCGKFIYNENEKEWEYEHEWKEMDEEDCLSAYKVLKKLNSQKKKRTLEVQER